MATTAISRAELQLAARNHGMPLEALAYDVTPAGLHYLLIHYDVPVVQESGWRLAVDGLVDTPLDLTLQHLRSLAAVTVPVTLECAGNGRADLDPRPLSQPWLNEAVGTAAWTGTPLRDVLEQAHVADSAVEVVFEGADHGMEGGRVQPYVRSLAIDEALRGDVLLVYGMNGGPLPPQHGHPLRLLVPGWYGMASVKWLRRVTLVDEPFAGYQQAVAYRLRQTRDEPGEPITRIEPRALMIPPGTPSFPERERFLQAGRCDVEGRAWSGWGPVVGVAVSVDGGATWDAAELEPPPSEHAWQHWSFAWQAPPGRHVVCCRATDVTGRTQPLAASWNLGGYCNNAVQRIAVTVTDDQAP